MRNLWFKLFEETRGIAIMGFLIAGSIIAFWGLIIYVAIHFIIKYW